MVSRPEDDDDAEDPRNFPGLSAQREEALTAIQARKNEQATAARKLLETRHSAYTRVFVEGTPSADDRRIVMEDMQRFCRGNMSAWSPDERIHCLLTGRQEVFVRIEDFTRLDLDTLYNKYARPPEE